MLTEEAEGKSEEALATDSAPEPQKSERLRVFQLSDPAEIDMLSEISEQGHRETRYGYLPFSEEKFRQRAMNILNHPGTSAGFYVVLNDRAVGLIDIGIGEPFLAQGGVIASCRSLYVSPDMRTSLVGGKVAALLLSNARKWAKSMGAEELMVYDRQGFVMRLLKGAEVDGANVVVRL
jgi:GNAT superfamily N-acetyltransferase